MSNNRFAGPELFQRQWRVTIPTSMTEAIAIDGLDIQARIEKSLRSEPNKCQLSIWNLNEQHRRSVANMIQAQRDEAHITPNLKPRAKKAARTQVIKGLPVKIEAGLGPDKSNVSLLWLGDLRVCYNERQGPDWVTHLDSGDGEKAYQNGRVNESFGPNTPVRQGLMAVVRSLGYKEADVNKVVNDLVLNGVGTIYPQGTVLSGPAARHLDELCKGCGLEWSIQDGNIQILVKGQPLQGNAIVCSAKSGMLDTPTIDPKGLLNVRMLIVPNILPGRIIQMEAKEVTGIWRAEKVTYVLDSAGNDWSVQIQASPL